MKIEKRAGTTNTWDMIVNGEICVTESFDNNSVYPTRIRGTETSKNNTPDFIQEFENLKKEKNNRWSSLTSSDGSDQQTGLTYDYFIDRRGYGNERMYHIETGQGTPRNC